MYGYGGDIPGIERHDFRAMTMIYLWLKGIRSNDTITGFHNSCV